MEEITFPIRVLKLLGVQTMIGNCRTFWSVTTLVLLTRIPSNQCGWWLEWILQCWRHCHTGWCECTHRPSTRFLTNFAASISRRTRRHPPTTGSKWRQLWFSLSRLVRCIRPRASQTSSPGLEEDGAGPSKQAASRRSLCIRGGPKVRTSRPSSRPCSRWRWCKLWDQSRMSDVADAWRGLSGHVHRARDNRSAPLWNSGPRLKPRD